MRPKFAGGKHSGIPPLIALKSGHGRTPGTRHDSRPLPVATYGRSSGARGILTTMTDWPALALEEWWETRDTVHRWTQVVGKIRMRLTPPINHWWHVPL